MERVELDRGWTVTLAGEVPTSVGGSTFPARVPGCVHLDLLRAGVIDDPLLEDHERSVAWIDDLDVHYRVSFEVGADVLRRARVDLALEEVDTFAQVFLNGELLGEPANMHHPHRFDVRSVLASRNILEVRLRSAKRVVSAEAARLGALPFLNTEAPFPFARKCAYHFGWDWAPALIGAGLGRVCIEAYDGARIVAVRPRVVELSNRSARLRVAVDVDGDPGVRLAVLGGGSRVEVSGAQEIELSVDHPRRWWPRGHGDQPMYDLEVLAEDGGERLVTRTGLRTVDLDTRKGAFTLHVNGKPIYCKGANFIPPDMFLSRATTPARYQSLLAAACDASMNTLRVWGGGLYETDAFYDRCDELGLLVLQDFLFACACYPEEEPHWSRVEAEARAAVSRLARHPSLVLYHGCNENLWGYFDWGWAEATRGRTWGRGYYFDLLPRILGELDPSRPYWPGSPYSGAFNPPGPPHPNDSAVGSRHVWEAWQGDRHPVVGGEEPRFVAEFGFQGPPSFALIERAMGGAAAALASHQKHPRAEADMDALARAHFGPRASFDREHHVRQVVQARAVADAIEWFRCRWPTNAGAIFWQLDDAWPAMSWSAIDYDGRKKPLYHAVRRAFSDRALFFQPSAPGASEISLYVINDHDEPLAGTVVVERRTFDGGSLARREVAVSVPPRRVVRAGPIDGDLRAGDPARELVMARGCGLEQFHFFAPDRALALPRARVRGQLRGGLLTLEADTLVRDAVLHVDRLHPEASLSDQLFTMMPGDSREIRLESPVPIEVDQLLAHPVFQSSAPGP